MRKKKQPNQENQPIPQNTQSQKTGQNQQNQANLKFQLLGSAPVPRALLALGLPTMLGMLINALYNLADTYFAGGLGTDQMGAITVAFPIGQGIVGVGLLFGNGAAAYLSRLLGKGEKEKANCVASTAVYAALAAGAVLIICTMLFLNPLLRQLGAMEEVMPHARSYARIYILFSIFNVFNVTMNNIVSSEGAAKTAMCTLLTGAVINVLLDPLFIYGFELGVSGAAAATAISQGISALIYLFYIFRKKSLFRFDFRSCSFSREIMAEILKVGVPTLIFQLLSSGSAAMINDAAKEYGKSALAAMGPVTKIMSVGSLMVFGFLKGFQPVAGFCCGAKNYGRLKEAIRISVLWSSLFCILFGLGAAIFAPRILNIFTKNDLEMVQTGQTALRASGLSFFIFGFHTVYCFLFLVMGKAKEGCILGACRQGICFVPVILMLPRFLGLKGVLYAQPAADLIAGGITVWMALRLRREIGEAAPYKSQ